jgi:hypothetical protein
MEVWIRMDFTLKWTDESEICQTNEVQNCHFSFLQIIGKQKLLRKTSEEVKVANERWIDAMWREFLRHGRQDRWTGFRLTKVRPKCELF